MFDDYSSSFDFPLLFDGSPDDSPFSNHQITMKSPYCSNPQACFYHPKITHQFPWNHHEITDIWVKSGKSSSKNHPGNPQKKIGENSGAFFCRSFCRSALAARRSALAVEASSRGSWGVSGLWGNTSKNHGKNHRFSWLNTPKTPKSHGTSSIRMAHFHHVEWEKRHCEELICGWKVDPDQSGGFAKRMMSF